jgi:hypothetical protein
MNHLISCCLMTVKNICVQIVYVIVSSSDSDVCRIWGSHSGSSSCSSVFWDIMPCSPLKVNQCFGGICHLWNISWPCTDYTAFHLTDHTSIRNSLDSICNIRETKLPYQISLNTKDSPCIKLLIHYMTYPQWCFTQSLLSHNNTTA